MSKRLIAWGNRVSSTFIDRARWIVDDLDIGEDSDDGLSKLLSCIAWESGRTFSAAITNKAGSGATGLIQFMPSTAKGLGTTTEKLALMSPEDQLNYVWKYFAPYKGKLKTLSDLYMAILWSKGVGKPETYVLWTKGQSPTTFRQNAGLDINHDATITKSEATAKLTATMAEGMQPENALELNGSSNFKVHEAVISAANSILPEAVHEAVSVASVVAPKSSQRVLEAIADKVAPEVPHEPEVKTKAEKVHEAVKGTPGTIAGVFIILGSLLANPDFSAQLGKFTTGLASGDGSWGAALAIVGAALVAYKGTRRT